MTQHKKSSDPLVAAYRGSISESPSQLHKVGTGRVALLCIDLQYLDAARGCGVFSDGGPADLDSAALDYYFGSLEASVLPNVARLQATFRDLGLEVIHTRIQSLTQDGRDRSSAHKRLQLHAAPGSKEAQFLEAVAPAGDEIIFNKTASGVFSSTNIAYVLRNMDIQALYVCGVYTNECVSTTVRHASDLGYHTTLIQDACTTVTPTLQASTIRVLRDRYARILRTSQAVREVERLHPASAAPATNG